MTTFKVGDKVKVRKLSEIDYKEVYIKLHSHTDYKSYLDRYSIYFDKIFLINKIRGDTFLEFQNINIYFYPEELEKVYSLKDKLVLVKKLIT
jgi:hypothetical protein